VPFGSPVAVGDQSRDPFRAFDGDWAGAGIPTGTERRTDGIGFHAEIGDEIEMGPVLPVRGLDTGLVEEGGDTGQIEVEEEGPVEHEGGLTPTLGVAGEFAVTEDEVGVTADPGRAGEEGAKGIADPGKDPVVGAGDGFEFGMEGDGECDGVIEATRPLDHGPAAGTTTKDGNAPGMAGIGIDFPGDGLAVADDDPVDGAFPEPDQGAGLVGIDGIQGGLIPGQTGFRGGIGRQDKGAHGRILPWERAEGQWGEMTG
jgi:hypothetical protein